MPVAVSRVVDHQMQIEADLQDPSWKEVVYVLPITTILGRLPVVRAGDTGTIPFSYRNGCRNGAHRYDHALAKADTSAGAGDGCPMYFVNSWALGWSRDPWS